MPVDMNLELRLAYLRAAANSQADDEKKIIAYRDFFAGDQGLPLTDRQKEYLKVDAESIANLCKRVVGIPKERLALSAEGIAAAATGGPAFAEAATTWWAAAGLDAKQKELYEATLRDGQAALIVDWDAQNARPSFTPNLVYDGETGLIRFHYDSDGGLLFASKRWTLWNPLESGETGKRRLTVYRPDSIERYEADPKTPGGWRFLQPAEIGGIPNPQPWVDSDGLPLGIPVIPFDNPGGSELADVLRIQELITHALTTFDIATDYHGWPLLWLMNLMLERDEDGNQVLPDFSPGNALILENGGGAGRIEVADLTAIFQGGVQPWVQVLALIKGWPLFLFDRNQQPPSGLALKIMEGGLVSQVEDKQTVFGAAWQQAFDLARKLARVNGAGDFPGELNFTWRPAATADPAGDIETKAKKFEAGQIPLEQRWEELGYTAEQIAKMKGMREAEEERAARIAQRNQPQVFPENGNTAPQAGAPNNQPNQQGD